MNWTSEAVATLKADWQAGVDPSLIARKLGTNRSAVSAKRYRLGLPARGPVATEDIRRRNGKAHAHYSAAPPRGRLKVDKMAPLAGSTPRPWMQRETGECAFPVQAEGSGRGADTWSCCLPEDHPGTGYCQGHQAIRHGRPWPPADLVGRREELSYA